MGFSEVKEAIDAIGRLGMAVVVDDRSVAEIPVVVPCR